MNCVSATPSLSLLPRLEVRVAAAWRTPAPCALAPALGSESFRPAAWVSVSLGQTPGNLEYQPDRIPACTAPSDGQCKPRRVIARFGLEGFRVHVTGCAGNHCCGKSCLRPAQSFIFGGFFTFRKPTNECQELVDVLVLIVFRRLEEIAGAAFHAVLLRLKRRPTRCAVETSRADGGIILSCRLSR